MAAIDQAMVSKMLNQTTPTGASGIPGSFGTALSASAMKVRLNSALSTASAAGTEIASGGGYVTGGTALSSASTASSAGSAVTLPAGSALTWTNSSGGAWSIVSMDLTDSTGSRAWFGPFNGQPISIAIGNSFQIAVGGCTIALS